jgi:hypothetical protein
VEKAGTGAFFGVGRERELWHEQHRAADIAHREVHACLGVGEDAIGEHARGEARGALLGILAAHPDERQEASADGRDALLAQGNFRAADALYEGDHGRGGQCGICRDESVRFGAILRRRGDDG